MANSQRRKDYIDRNGNMFIPMNVEGGSWNDKFMTTPKYLSIAGIVGVLFFIIASLNSSHARLPQYAIYLTVWFIISLYVTRFIIFEEKFYYKMYKDFKKYEISSPAIFWDIASIKDTDEGAIITFSDAKIGIMLKLERDTITGKNKEFKETHYDAISDFYKEVMTNRYSFVQMNIMEQAGKDPRLNELSKIVYKSDNDNICKLMELQVGHIKNITHAALYESDYFLFYTHDLSQIDNIIQDISECVFKILDGAYIGYQLLTSKDIVDLVKELYGVNYFNATEASLLMFDKNLGEAASPLKISGILWDDGYEQKLNEAEIIKLRGITSKIVSDTISAKSVSFKKTFYRKDEKGKVGIDFETLGNVPIKNNNQVQKNKAQTKTNSQNNSRQANMRQSSNQQQNNVQRQSNINQQQNNMQRQQMMNQYQQELQMQQMQLEQMQMEEAIMYEQQLQEEQWQQMNNMQIQQDSVFNSDDDLIDF